MKADTGKDFSILMVIFIIFTTGLGTGMAMPDELTYIIAGVVMILITLVLVVRSVLEFFNGYDERDIDNISMEDFTNKIYGNQPKKQKRYEGETEMEHVTAGKKAKILAKIKREREQKVNLEIN